MLKELTERLPFCSGKASDDATADGDARETAKVYVTPGGARYVKVDEVFASRRGQELLKEWRRGLDRPRATGDTRRRVCLSGSHEELADG